MDSPTQTPSERPVERPVDRPTDRPTGITILAVLAAIGGVFSILGGIALVGLGGALATGGLGGMAALVGFLVLILGVLYLVLAYGFWTLQPWAWLLGVGLQAASIVLTLIQLIGGTSNIVSAVISIAISAAILYYLYQPHVKAAFGRA